MATEITPNEITIEFGHHIAEFDYYDGIRYAKEQDFLFTTRQDDIYQGHYYLVSCGKVYLEVNELDYPEIKRINIAY